MTDIPKGTHGVDAADGAQETPGPCWFAVVDTDGNALKPVIKCQCGVLCGIGLHHVHSDGTVTNSFYHSEAAEFTDNGKQYTHRPGCGWHVWLRLLDYDKGDFPSCTA